MPDYYIAPSNETPEIDFRYSAHALAIRGESYPENALAFYAPVRASLQGYLESLSANSHTRVEIALRYFNSSSTKLIRNLVAMLDQAAQNGRRIGVVWLHDADDDMMLEFGQDLREEHDALEFTTVALDDAAA